MTELAAPANGGGVLASIRQLEQSLAARSTTVTTTEGYLEEARVEAASILAAARQDAVDASAKSRVQVTALADREATEIRHRADARAAEVRERAASRLTATVDAALALIVGAEAESEA